MNYDTWKATESQRPSGGHVSRRALFPASCDGLVTAVRVAADPARVGGWHERTVVSDAVATAQRVMRNARALGMYPSTAQLAIECGERTDELTLELECAR